MHPRAIPASHDVATFSDRDARDARPPRRGRRHAMTSIERRGRGRESRTRGFSPARAFRRVIPSSVDEVVARVPRARPRRGMRARLGPLPEPETRFFPHQPRLTAALSLSRFLRSPTVVWCAWPRRTSSLSGSPRRRCVPTRRVGFSRARSGPSVGADASRSSEETLKPQRSRHTACVFRV